LGGDEQVFVSPEGIVGIKCHSGDSVFHADILAQTIRFANHACLRTELRGKSVLSLFTAVAGYFFTKKKNKTAIMQNELRFPSDVHICDVLT
jgi:hypothetical protein